MNNINGSFPKIIGCQPWDITYVTHLCYDMIRTECFSVHCTDSWSVAAAFPASFSTSHVKLAPLSSRLSCTSTDADVIPNLTDVGTSVTPLLSRAPLRYHVTFGTGFPPVDSHVNRMCSDSRGSRDNALVDTVGAPGFTVIHKRYSCSEEESIYSMC